MKNHHHNGHIDPATTPRNVIHEAIAARAYELWLQAGQPENQADTFWFAAEREQVTGEPPSRRKKATPDPILPVSF